MTHLKEVKTKDQLKKFVKFPFKLYKGNCMVMGRKANKSLYDQHVVTFEEGGEFDITERAYGLCQRP